MAGMRPTRARRRPQGSVQNRQLVEPATLVLVVDDDQDVACSITDALAMEGYRAAPCLTAEAALAQIRMGAHPSLVIVDLWIPAMGSATLLLTLRDLLPSTPVLLLSGSARDLERAALQAEALLVKPVESTTLVRMVDKMVRQTRREMTVPA